MSDSWPIDEIRAQFPILDTTVYGKPLVYLDNAATTQKPETVLRTLDEYYRQYNSNVHRGVHHLSQLATNAHEAARETVRSFINAASSEEIVFTRGTTESINLVASGFAKKILKSDDVVLITAMEHHSNIVPWQLACEESGAELRVIPMTDSGELILDELDELLSGNVKMVAVTMISNSLGTINPVETIITAAHQRNIPVLLDAAQSAPHQKIDVQTLVADFLAFSGHKLYGPTGIGVLYGKRQWLDLLPPYQGGGEMIREVSFEKTTYNDPPFKFEAGTPDIAGTIGLAAAIDFLNQYDLGQIAEYEKKLTDYALVQLKKIDGMRIIGQAQAHSSAISFLVRDIHPYDMGELLDKMGIAVRTGHHCTQPVMDRLGIPGTVRASLALYNTAEEIDILVDGVKKAAAMLS